MFISEHAINIYARLELDLHAFSTTVLKSGER